MPVITATIGRGEQHPEVAAMQQALISLGAHIASDELATATTAGTYGPTTRAATNALLNRFGVASFILQPFNASVGRLLNIAVGAELGHSAGLRQAVRESIAARQIEPAAHPSELVWHARYATMARDFTTARKILDLIPDDDLPSVAMQDLKRTIASIVTLSTLQPPAPELLNPENYYTVLYDYVPRSTLNRMLQRG
jgi:hypothetical protein